MGINFYQFAEGFKGLFFSFVIYLPFFSFKLWWNSSTRFRLVSLMRSSLASNNICIFHEIALYDDAQNNIVVYSLLMDKKMKMKIAYVLFIVSKKGSAVSY